MTRKALYAVVALALLTPTTLAARQKLSEAEMARMMAEMRAGHIAANLPPASMFEDLLKRDVTAYLASKGLVAQSVSIELLRREPTQVGIAFPKFYLWVRATGARERLTDGAMEVAAVKRVRF